MNLAREKPQPQKNNHR